MLKLLEKSSVDPCCIKEQTRTFWNTEFNNADIRGHGVALLILVMFLYNISKLVTFRNFWRRTISWLPFWPKRSNIEKRIDSLTSDLRTEMRELSEQIVEFKKWSKIKLEGPEIEPRTLACIQCKWSKAPLRPHPAKAISFSPPNIDNEISECNWLQYLHKYVYNPNPRILDTGELENTKRAYSHWF